MNKQRLLSATALRSIAAFGLAVGFANPAMAQEPTPAEQAADQPGEDPPEMLQGEVELQSGEAATTRDEIVVTGSRIRRPNLESTVPITSLSGESLFQQGDTNIGDTLAELPQIRSTFVQSNPGLGIGIAGLNLLDLRGLATKRTLVLVNGRRHVAADILNSAVSPDVNSIPNDLIERVDIVTGGNSAIYGSDAIAGVVNFVLRRDYDGLQIRGQAGVSPRGFGGNQYISAMYGHNFADDRANVTLHAEYANQDRFFGSDLPWLDEVNGLVVVDVDPGGLPNGSDGSPDTIFLRDIRSVTIHRYGLIPVNQPAGNPLCGVGTAATVGGPNNAGNPYNCTYVFDAQGNLAAQTGTRFGQGITGGILGGNGQTGREDNIFSIQPHLQRYNINLLAHYRISDALEPFIEAKWTRLDVLGNNAGPSFIQGTFGTFDFRERVRLDNPFLDPAQRTLLANAILASGCNTSLTTACSAARSAVQGQGIGGPLNAADIQAINDGTYRFVLARQLLDAGIRDEKMQRDTYRLVGGFRGTFNDDWNYEVSVNYGKYKEDKTTFGFIDRQRFALAMDAGINPNTGQIQCRSQFDPTAAVGYDVGAFQTGGASRGNTSQAARLAADIAACVPYNPFGGTDNSAAVDYFSINAHAKASLRQFVVNGFVSGDSSQLFELPGGPVRFALGAEYRREKGDYIDDEFTNFGDPFPPPATGINPATRTNSNAVVIGRFNPPAFKVAEAFGEIQIPILKDVFLAHDLTLSGAARFAKYSGAAEPTGNVWAYNAGIDWAPVRDIRFRANYSRAVRAPNLAELFFPPVPNFAPGFVDPCSQAAIANNPNRTANCNADLGPLLANLPNVAYSLPVISGSNPNLFEETSDSYTIGTVIQPRFIPGMSLSVDYYKIVVNDVIVALSAQQIANLCYDQPSLNNVFCGLFTRWRGPGNSPQNFVPGQILENSLIQAGVNFAARKRRGIDVNWTYRTDVGPFKYNGNLIFTHNLQISNFQNPAIPDFEDVILGELGDPKNEFRWDNDVTWGKLTLGYRMRYIGRMYTTAAVENFIEAPGACTGASCPPFNLDAAEPRKYPAVFYHDLRFQFDVNPRHQFYFGVDNVLDTHPPLGLAGTGTGGITDRGTGNAAIYDAFGRKVYAGFRARF